MLFVYSVLHAFFFIPIFLFYICMFFVIERKVEQDQAMPPKVPPPPHSPQPQLIPHFYNIYEPVVFSVDNHPDSTFINGAPAPPVRKHPITIGGYKLPRQRSSLSAAEQLGVTSPSPFKSNGGIAFLLGKNLMPHRRFVSYVWSVVFYPWSRTL